VSRTCLLRTKAEALAAKGEQPLRSPREIGNKSNRQIIVRRTTQAIAELDKKHK
jgi:hypothetical protein